MSNAPDNPHHRLAERFINELGLTDDDAARLARRWHDEEPIEWDTERSHEGIVGEVRRWREAGFPEETLVDWMTSTPTPIPDDALLFRDLGYTPEQYGAVSPFHWDITCGEPPLGQDEHPEEDLWRHLLTTVPPDFMALCVQANPNTIAEIERWNDQRLAGDPDLRSQLSFLAALD